MDSLFSILLIVGLVLLGSSNKKKQAQKAASKRKNAFDEATSAIRQAQKKKPFAKQDWINFVMEQTASTPQPAKAAPNSKAKPAPRVKPNKGAPDTSKKQVSTATVPKPAQPTYEGTVSTQGESAAEHAAHMARIRAEEAQAHQAEQTLQELRNLNRQKLRSAVVMSEVLGKPVSLRPRAHR